MLFKQRAHRLDGGNAALVRAVEHIGGHEEHAIGKLRRLLARRTRDDGNARARAPGLLDDIVDVSDLTRAVHGDEEVALPHARRGIVPDPVHFFAQVHQAHGKRAGGDAFTAYAHHKDALGGDDLVHQRPDLPNILRLKDLAMLFQNGLIQFLIASFRIHLYAPFSSAPWPAWRACGAFSPACQRDSSGP